MKKIFFEERKIIISERQPSVLTAESPCFTLEKQSEVNAALHLFWQDNRTSYQLITKNEKKLFRKFKRNFDLIEAAGGAVLNDKGQLLVIERFGKWDLPKGHIEAGETAAEAALREVEEECGVSGLALGKKLGNTWHVFDKKGKHKLKKTHWYLMRLAGCPTLTPQTEESITAAHWVNLADLPAITQNTWGSLLDIFECVLAHEQ